MEISKQTAKKPLGLTISEYALFVFGLLLLVSIAWAVAQGVEEFNFSRSSSRSLSERIVEHLIVITALPFLLFVGSLAARLWYGRKWLFALTMFVCGVTSCWLALAIATLYNAVLNDLP